MPSEVERFLFGDPVVGHFVERFDYSDHSVVIRLRPIESQNSFSARFEKAEILTVELDATDAVGGVLDIIGFDCYSKEDCWQFVLTCDSVAWTWNSQWPAIVGA